MLLILVDSKYHCFCGANFNLKRTFQKELVCAPHRYTLYGGDAHESPCAMRLAGFIKPLLLRVNKSRRLPGQHYATSVESEEYVFDTKEYIDFKKQLRQQNVNNKDGHTCLQLECRLCERMPATSTTRAQGPLAYINKKTGMLYVKDLQKCNVRWKQYTLNGGTVTSFAHCLHSRKVLTYFYF